MEKSESIKELAIALNKAQATLQVAKKGSENPFFHSKYADLLSIWDACREALTSNGLSIAQIADTDLEGKAVLETILMHTSGEWIMGRLPLLPVKTDPQAQGSAITYARRYSLSAIVGLCTEEDDDAEAGMNRKGPKKEIKEQKTITAKKATSGNEPTGAVKKAQAKVSSSMPTGKKVQNIAELKRLLMDHMIPTNEAYEILSIKRFDELTDLDEAWVKIKEAKGKS